MLLPLLANLDLGGGTPAVDLDLDTISGGIDGMLLTLKLDSAAAGDVTLKHNTGNLLLNGAADFVLDAQGDRVLLQYDGDLSKWVQTNGSNA